MKFFQTLLLLIVVVLVGGLALMYWTASVQETTVPVAEVTEATKAAEATQVEQLSPGSYLIFQNVNGSEYDFYRFNLADQQLTKFFTVEQGGGFSGSLTSYIFGQDLLMHRYQKNYDEELDGIVSLTGEVKEIIPQNWGVIRSKNGRYEVSFTSIYANSRVGATDMQVKDLDTETVLAEFTLDSQIHGGTWTPEPFFIDDEGKYLYAHGVCGCEATVPDLWEVNVQTTEIRQLDTLVDLQEWRQSDINAQTRKLIAVHTKREPSQDGPGDTLLPPSTIQILDLDAGITTDAVMQLLIDDTMAWLHPILDPTGKDRYIVQSAVNYELQLVNFEDKAIVQYEYIRGFVRDWVGDWIVVQDPDNASLRLENVNTGEIVELPPPGEGQFDFIGSVKIE